MHQSSLDSAEFAKYASVIFQQHLHDGVLQDGWFVREAPGHTPETYYAETTRCGRDLGVFYMLSRLAGGATVEYDDSGNGLLALRRLASLVVTDPGDPMCGCMRWFAEETAVSDTNAAFFSLMPIVVLMQEHRSIVPDDEQEVICDLLRSCLPWFTHECREPRLYYPNKIISDGAILLGVGSVLGEASIVDQAVDFLRRWVAYTQERGWGWGENISLGYQRVILVALRLCVRALGDSEHDLRSALGNLSTDLLDEAAFHDGMEFVPAIRSYNFTGRLERPSLAAILNGHPDQTLDHYLASPGQSWAKAIALVLFEGELLSSEYSPPETPRTRTVRVFDSSQATTWIGQGVRLGSVSRFPVMPDHYQQSGWGLGWQSFPVSAAVEGKGVSKLLWHCAAGAHETTHPFYGEDGIHRNYVLVGKEPYPSVTTRSAQAHGTAIVVRTIARVHDDPVTLSDQWLFKGGGVREIDGWYCQTNSAGFLAVRPLLVWRSGSEHLEPPVAEVIRLDEDLAVRVSLHDESLGSLAANRLECAWLMAARDGDGSPESVGRELAAISWTDEAVYEFSAPRMLYAYIRRIVVSGTQESEPLELSVDYHHDLWR